MAAPFTIPPELDLTPEPDLHPIYPTAASVAPLLSGDSGLTPAQKAELVAHCAHRACVFGDLSLLQYLILDAQAQPHVDLSRADEDGLNLADVAISGFGAESDRDVEREECVRFLINQGVDVKQTDKAGWTTLHHAALVAPPTLISFLLTHGGSPLAKTLRGLTPLDIVTAHSTIPGKEDIALLLEEAMRYDGWTGGKMEQKRHEYEERSRRMGKRRAQEDQIADVLDVNPRWWNRADVDLSEDVVDDEDRESEVLEDAQYTPPADYESMLVFEPSSLPVIFDSIITHYLPRKQDTTPANTLYMMARFACLTCDYTWLEDLIVGATDTIEEAFYHTPEDVPTLLFWLHNTTAWLHLMRCDSSISEACDILGSFSLVEEVINSAFVFIIRFAERRIDQLLDASFLDYLSPLSQADGVQFESEWSFLKSFAKKKQPSSTALDSTNAARARSATLTPSTSASMQSLRNTVSRVRSPNTTPLQAIFSDGPPPPSPMDVLSFTTALHSFMAMSGVNPALITQIWSQVIYWTACETFNRIMTRKKFLCRSRAKEIASNISILEDWVSLMGLPEGIRAHFAPVKDLLTWLQMLSDIRDFPSLISTIQQLRDLNPLQMRRAVREYKYEVNEEKMTEECAQYLAQLQKDWERHRVKLGVEALRREIDERGRDDSESSSNADTASQLNESVSDASIGQGSIDVLFDREHGKSEWQPAKPPQVLGELLDSRFMLPLLLPSDPKLLSAVPGKVPALEPVDARNPLLTPLFERKTTSSSDASVLAWKARGKTLREVDLEMLHRIDGHRRRPRHWVNVNLDLAYTETVMPSPVEGKNLLAGELDHAGGRRGPTRRRSTRRSEHEKLPSVPLSGDDAKSERASSPVAVASDNIAVA